MPMHRVARRRIRCSYLLLILFAVQTVGTAAALADGETCVRPREVNDSNQPPGEVCAIDEDVGPVPADDVPPIWTVPFEAPALIVQLGPDGPVVIVINFETTP